ncbi:hypothetical protein [Marinobacter sp. KMM 10035]|uniref:hypothetical protein n=1 Tax=Marinobacter sp. KMM 10035 TaxID=3134034 RepID=UPI00397CB684
MKKIVTVLMAVVISGLVQAQEVTKEQWVSAMKIVLPAAMCQSAEFFRQCYKVSAVECEEVASSTTRTCLNNLDAKMPSKLVLPKDGAFWGDKVGQCAGVAYSTVIQEKFTNNENCLNPGNWQ